MPKVKTKAAAKKRFKKLASGIVKRAKAFKRHLLTKKSAKRKRGLRKIAYINKADQSAIVRLLPY